MLVSVTFFVYKLRWVVFNDTDSTNVVSEMGDGKMDNSFPEIFLRLPLGDNYRAMSFVVNDLNFRPRNLTSQSGSQCLRECFLSGKSGGIGLIFSFFSFLTELSLLFCKDSLTEPVTEI